MDKKTENGNRKYVKKQLLRNIFELLVQQGLLGEEEYCRIKVILSEVDG